MQPLHAATELPPQQAQAKPRKRLLRRAVRRSRAALPKSALSEVARAAGAPSGPPFAKAGAAPSRAKSEDPLPKDAPESASATAPAPAAESKPKLCPDDMQEVTGSYCLDVEQLCLEYVTPEGEEDKDRCARYAESKCLPTAPRRRMSFCMDRWEYPNREGELPMTLVDWGTAAALCQKQNKRLCSEAEFNLACEGEQMQPYATGFERAAHKCNIDQPFSKRPRVILQPDAECQATPKCARERARLDKRHRIGEDRACVSPFGIYDLNGNVNEWVALPGNQPPHRAALKSGWWGPVRNRCRAIAASHKESYIGYEVGFRCCSDVSR